MRRHIPTDTTHFMPAIMLVISLAASTSTQGQSSRILFEDQFTNGVKPQWSANRVEISTTPAGNKQYLGPFGGESVLLNLTDLPDHQLVKLSMDLAIIRSWDGSAPMQGPDVFDIFTDDGRLIYSASFGWPNPQSYPGFFSVHTAPPGYGATATNTLGFIHENKPCDGVFHIECLVPHHGGKLGFRFLATTQSAITDEAWGILNASVTLEDPPPPDSATLATAWEQLSSVDPAESTRAVWHLVEGGDAAVKLLSNKLAAASLPPDIELLNPTRGAARRLPVPGTDGFAIADAAQRQTVLGAHVLQVIGTPDARDLLRVLPRQNAINMRTITVTVRDINTHDAIPFIPVWVYTWGDTLHAEILTDSNGQATVDLPAEFNGQIYFENPRCVYVPVGKVIQTRNLPTDVVLPLDRAVPIGGIVVDDAGKPIEGANIVFRLAKTYSEPSLSVRLDGLVAATDQEGRWMMDLGPETFNTLQLGVRGPQEPTGGAALMTDYGPRLAELHSRSAVMKIPKPMVLKGTVVDSGTAKPIEKFRVSYSLALTTGAGARGGRPMTEFLALTSGISPGEFNIPIAPTYPGVTVRVEADDYASATSDLISGENLQNPLTINLRKLVVETALEDPLSANAKSYLDFDTGKKFTYGESMPENFLESRRWISDTGVDLMCETRQPSEGFVAYDMTIIPTDTAFDRPRNYDELKRMLDDNQPEPFKIVPTPLTSLPKTLLFRTREGAIGVLEASAATETPPGMKLRYKLVPKPEPVPADGRGGRVVVNQGIQVIQLGGGQLILPAGQALTAQQLQQLQQQQQQAVAQRQLQLQQQQILAQLQTIAQQQAAAVKELAQLQQQLQQLHQTLPENDPQVIQTQQRFEALQKIVANQPQRAAVEQRLRLQLEQMQQQVVQQQLRQPIGATGSIQFQTQPAIQPNGPGLANLSSHERLQRLADLYGEKASVQMDIDAATKKLGDRKAVDAEARAISNLQEKLRLLQTAINQIESATDGGKPVPATKPAGEQVAP